MSDTPKPDQDNTPPRPATAVRKTAARAAQAGISLIWLVPIVALVVVMGVAWNAYAGRGTLISVAFKDATGIMPGETLLKFREITVGKVETVRFSEDLSHVVVNVRVDKDLSEYIDNEAEFWIVRPQVTAQGISRIDTVLTGAFIEGHWDDKIGEKQTRFEGLDRAPLSGLGQPGTWVVLSSPDAKGMSDGAPVMFRGLPVGRMQNLRLSEHDESVLSDVFIAAPHDARLSSSTVFWNTSGFSVSLGTQGVSLNVGSLASLLQGGAEFATLASGGEPVEQGHIFALHPDEAAARSNLFSDDTEALRISTMIDGSVKGLSTGANVQFMGLTVGRVTDISAVVVPVEGQGPALVRQRLTLAITPSRLGLSDDSDDQQALDFLSSQVTAGLRARVASAGFFGTSLEVELVDLPDIASAQMDLTAKPYPMIPSAPGDITDFTGSAQGLLTRVGNLPIEEVLKSASDMMNSVTALASSEDTRAIPGALRQTLDEAQAAVGEVKSATAELRESGALTQLRGMIDEAAGAAEAVRLAAADVPSMVEQIDAAAAKVGEVDFASLGTEAEGILADLRAMLGTEDAAQLPRNLSDTLKAASGLLTELSDGGAAGSLNAALGSAKTAADEVAVAAQRMPALAERLDRLAARAESVVAAYGDRSNFNSEALNLMREMRRAASSFGALARTIERNPQSFILGR